MAPKKETQVTTDAATDVVVTTNSPQNMAAEKAAPQAQPVVLAKAGPKLVKIKFVKPHEFMVALAKKAYKKDDVTEVEIHIANALSARGIAVLMN
jgi:hypothetical protein